MSVIAVASLLATQGTTTLLLQPKVGASYKYANTVVQVNPMTGGNQTISSNSTTTVKSFSGGYYTLSLTTSNVKITGGAQGSDQMKKMMEGKTQTMVVDKYGTPKKDASGMSPGIQQIMSSMGNSASGMMFPKKPVKVGDTWSNTVDMGSAMNAAAKQGGMGGMKGNGKLTVTFKLISVDGSTANVGCTLSGSMTMDMGAINSRPGQNQAPVNFSMKMKGTGSYKVERSSGMLLTSSMKMTLNTMGRDLTTTVSAKRI